MGRRIVSTRRRRGCVGPLSSKDLLGAVFVVDADEGMCPGCKAILDEVGATYAETWYPRGVDEGASCE